MLNPFEFGLQHYDENRQFPIFDCRFTNAETPINVGDCSLYGGINSAGSQLWLIYLIFSEIALACMNRSK
jgi:hypothetical protein